ncbi:DUF2189 domain-containing protein [Jannaschia seohaensis]|uniref:Putative membrane protein n=1 Tax=Jannaschia seohaensis TaxID=475081 RepID=A0A2Y9B622_9RHOB|nr:DUF2189 domain-containing protein [Jannaschia seohaensis]PWJ12447.1 putative membrane protein [Jannaschia seohaensis]SSA50928.1 Uncharacterized membrane protein [Jannaschia seohaensis]
MATAIQPETGPTAGDPSRLTLPDLGAVLGAGLSDFRRAPLFGLFFASAYVLGGLILTGLGAGPLTWTLAMCLGFPLAAPFLAVGLYEVSRRLEAGEPLSWPAILGVVWAERNRQMPWIGAMILIYLLFWSFLSHMIFALFMGPTALLGPPTELAAYTSGAGLAMVATQLVLGGVIAFLLFALTVIGLPMLLDREVDFVTAMLRSLALTRANLGVMLVWAALIAVATLAGMLPVFLGLFVVMPVLGHASWHLYRRATA